MCDAGEKMKLGHSPHMMATDTATVLFLEDSWAAPQKLGAVTRALGTAGSPSPHRKVSHHTVALQWQGRERRA